VIVTVAKDVPDFLPPLPVPPAPPQPLIQARLTTSSAKTGTRRRLECRGAAAIEPARSSAKAKRIPGGSTGCVVGRHGVGIENGSNLEPAAVVNVTVKAVAVVPFTVTEVGETVQVDVAGAPVQTSVTFPSNPLTGATWRL
jgi:hypothetical protein